MVLDKMLTTVFMLFTKKNESNENSKEQWTITTLELAQNTTKKGTAVQNNFGVTCCSAKSARGFSKEATITAAATRMMKTYNLT